MELNIALERGFVIDAFGMSLWFDQAPILKAFCDTVQEWRRVSKTEFEKSVYKLILNSLYGRMLMNTMKFSDSFIVTDKYSYQKLKNSNRVKFVGKISDSMLFVGMEKKNHTLSNPIAIGVAILGISKWIMLSHWFRMKDLIRDNLSNGSVDTDSFHNLIYNVDFYKRIADIINERNEMVEKYGKRSLEVLDRYFLCEEFDCSNFPKEHPCNDISQKKWFEKLKFEHAEQEILGFISPM